MLPKETMCCKEVLLSIIKGKQERGILAGILELCLLVVELTGTLAETIGDEANCPRATRQW